MRCLHDELMSTHQNPESRTLSQSLGRGPVPIDDSRPFGAHVRMAWWKALIILVVPLVAMLILQFVFTIVAILIDTAVSGRDPMSAGLTPLMLLGTNLSLILMGVLAVALTALLTRTPVRQLLASPRRFRFSRLALFTGLFGVLVLAGLALMQVLVPGGTGLHGFAVSGTTLALIVIAVLTTPLQAAGEEITYRGTMMPAISSWIRPGRAAVIVGLLASSIVFGISHASIDPWLWAYYTLFGLCMAAMAVITRGLEAPIAFHASNNLIMMLLAALFADGGSFTIDRSVGMGGPFMLVFMAVDVVAVGVVWLLTRRRSAQDPR